MIEQQIYIKTGIGLETCAKSTVITEDYIDNYIRPFYSSLDLFYLEGKDSPGYKSLIPLSNGSLMIGTGVKLDKEPYSFIHNYIIPAEEIDKFITDSATLLAVPDLNASGTPYLPSLKEIPENKTRREFLASFFKALNITHMEYMALIATIFTAVEQNRNVFISLPRKTSVDEICAIMYDLYESLPYYIRRCTGFSTLFGETEIRPEIKIYFVPDDKIAGRDHVRIDSYDASKDYIFNFSNKSRSHIPDCKESLSEEYLTFVSEKYSSGNFLSDFFEFAEEAERDYPSDRNPSLRFYNDLTYIYNIKANEETLPQRLARITIVFAEFLRANKPRIISSYSEFIKLYRRYLKQRGILIPPEILKRLVLTYDVCPDTQKSELYDLITLDIDACLKDSENEILFMHIDATKASSVLYNKIIEQKMAPSNRLIKRYFTYLIDQRKTVHSVMEFADNIFSEMPQIADNEFIRTMLCDTAMELYDTSGDRFEAVKYLEEKCLALTEKYPDNADLFTSIYRYALGNYMSALDVSELNMAKIEKFPLTDGESINDECTFKHKIALATKEIMALTNDLAMSFIHYDSFGFEHIRENLATGDSDGKAEEEALKSTLLRCLREKKDSPKRIIYTILYYIYDTKDSRIQVDFDSILDFIDKELSVPPFEFIEWFLSSNLFLPLMIKNGKIVRDVPGLRPDFTIITEFYKSLRKYFIKHNSLLTNDRNIKKLKKELDSVLTLHPDYKTPTVEFKKVLSGIVSEHYSPIKRIVNRIVSAKNFKFILMLSVVALIISGGFAIGGLFTAKNDPDVVTTINVTTGEKININKTGWSAYKFTKNKDYLPAAYSIDGTEKSELLSSLDKEILVVDFGTTKGLSINGISISAELSDEFMSMDVHVYDENDKKMSIGVSDYDITTGSSLYTFTAPMCIKKISISPKTESDEGTITIKEVNAYLIK